MPNDSRGNCCGNGNGGFLDGLFGENSEILFFLVVFLLLFTDFGVIRR